MHYISRREFLKVSTLIASSLMISTGLSACLGDNDYSNAITFEHGIASGDPLHDKVIIWTRVTPVSKQNLDKHITVTYEAATDKDFKNLVHSGEYITNKNQDFTVKIDLHNLEAATHYYYRFSSNGTTSDTGITKTLPIDNPEQVKFAVFSCANYTNGYFNAYAEAAKINDLDATIYLGDYIYEVGMYANDDFETKVPAYATENAKAIGRVLPEDNNTELFTLDDYRKRYALYHTDQGLQAIHKLCPMIAVWDDHEIANDAYKDGAENHSADEGDFTIRTEHALQAYFEWLPIRPVENQKDIYRTFEFGNLVSLHMLETRLCGREKQLNYADYYDAVFDISSLSADFDFDTVSITTDLAAPRSMLGTEQLIWLQEQLQSSTAVWQVLGQQVLMARMTLPTEFLKLVGMFSTPELFGTTREILMEKLYTLTFELLAIKKRVLEADPTLTEEEKARIKTVLPYNLDAWDGYTTEREIILETAKTLQKNLVVFAGDTHNSWANNLKTLSGEHVGVEFATTSITSPGLEKDLQITDVTMAIELEEIVKTLIDDLHYANIYDRGFMTVTFRENDAKAEWFYIDNYDSTDYTLNSNRTHSLTVGPGENLKIT